jgi:hypothetical protein
MIWPADTRCIPVPTQRPCEKFAEMLRKKSNFIDWKDSSQLGGQEKEE